MKSYWRRSELQWYAWRGVQRGLLSSQKLLMDAICIIYFFCFGSCRNVSSLVHLLRGKSIGSISSHISQTRTDIKVEVEGCARTV